MITAYAVVIAALEELARCADEDKRAALLIAEDALGGLVTLPKGVRIVPIVEPARKFKRDPIPAVHHRGRFAVVTAHQSIRLIGAGEKVDRWTGEVTYEPTDLTYAIGDRAVSGSYNFVYVHDISDVLPGGAVAFNGGTKARLQLHEFAARNWAPNWERIEARNYEMMMTI